MKANRCEHDAHVRAIGTGIKSLAAGAFYLNHVTGPGDQQLQPWPLQ